MTRRRSPRGQFEQQLPVGSCQARLGAAACALRRPSGTNSAVPPRCLAGLLKSVERAARAGMGVSKRKFNREVVHNDGTELCAKKSSVEIPGCGDNSRPPLARDRLSVRRTGQPHQAQVPQVRHTWVPGPGQWSQLPQVRSQVRSPSTASVPRLRVNCRVKNVCETRSVTCHRKTFVQSGSVVM